jgi:LysM repeat protein
LPVTPTAGHTEVASTRPKSKHKKAVPVASHESPSVVHHKVKQGETLFSIASTYKTTVDALKRDNRNIATLRPGMVLVIRP